jgi:hypothetical protein
MDPDREPFVPAAYQRHGVSLEEGRNLYIAAPSRAGMSPQSAERLFGSKQRVAELVKKGLLKREGNFLTGYEYRVTPQGGQVGNDALAASQVQFKPPATKKDLNDMTYRYLVAKDNDERKEMLAYLNVPLKKDGALPTESEVEMTLYQRVLARANPVPLAEKLAASPHEAARARLAGADEQLEKYRQDLKAYKEALKAEAIKPTRTKKEWEARQQKIAELREKIPAEEDIPRRFFEASFSVPAEQQSNYQLQSHDPRQSKPVAETLAFLNRVKPEDGKPREALTTYSDPADDRAHYEHATRRINTDSRGETTATIVHEMGHHLEYDDPEVHAAAMAFLEQRTRGEENRPMSDFGSGYKESEVGKDDLFARAFGGDRMRGRYAGKDYGTRSSEIVSMGLEQLYKDAVAFARNDPEYFNFILGILHGDTRMNPVPEK